MSWKIHREKEVQEEVTVAESEIKKAPTKPEDDPDFLAQIKITEAVKDEKSQHPEPDTKVVEQQAAGHVSPAIQAGKNNQQAHAASMSATSEQEKKREPFTPESFKELLEKNLGDLEKQLPKNSEDAKKFKEEKPIEGIKKNISGQVTAESDKLAGPLKSEADKPAPESGAPILEEKPLPVANSGLAPKPLNAKAAIPKPKTSQEISMEKESQSLDDKMAENNVTDEQLAKSNEPKFTGALEQKNQAQTEAKQAPVTYRKKEGAQLGAAQNEAKIASQEGLAQMQGAKELSEKNVLASQTTNKTSDKTEQEKIFAEFEEIYEETKKTVTDSLTKLSEDVDEKFSSEAESAQKTFEKNVEDGLGEIYGWTVIDDWIFGADTEAIDKLFVVEKAKFIATMNTVLDAVSVIIADGLNAALNAIEEGKKKSKKKFDGLDESQKKLSEDAFNDFNDQYASLEDTVYQKQDELASGLAQSYKENVDSLQEKFDEIKESVSAGWIGGALNAIVGVIETIKKLGNLITSLLAEIQNVMGVIMQDPIGFVGTLFDGVGKGIDMFKANIQKHLLGGFVTWITGAMGPIGITIPDNLFSLQGVFSLVMQVLGLSWDYVREKSVKLLGEPMVNAMETGFEMFQTIKQKGVTGIWEQVQEKFTDIKETIIDSIKDMLITQVIEAGIKWLLSLLIPGAGFIKAIMAIKDLIVFFVESAIMLIPSLIQAIKSLASGNVSGVSKAIEKGLANLIPLVIGLFAKLIGLGGLVKKVQKIIKRIRKRIDRAVTKMIKKAKAKFNKIFGKKKPKKGQAKKIKEDNKNQKPDKITAKDRAMHKKIINKIEKKLGEKAKKGEPFDKFHARKKKQAKSLEDKYQPQLKKGINLDITFNSLEQDKKDNDVDFKIKIAPNNADGGGQAPGDGNSNEERVESHLEKEPELINIWVGKKVINKDKTINKTFWKLIDSGKSKKNKFRLKGQKKLIRAYILKGKLEKPGDPDRLIKVKIERYRAPKGLPSIFINEEGVLKKGAEKVYRAQKDHSKFNPKNLKFTYLEDGKYKIAYEVPRATDEAQKKGNSKFEVILNYNNVAEKVPDATFSQTSIGKELIVKPEEFGEGDGDKKGFKVGRGATDSSGYKGFDNAHLVGDRFGGSGLNKSGNVLPSSSFYNKQIMARVEEKLSDGIKKIADGDAGFKYQLSVEGYLKDDINGGGNSEIIKKHIEDKIIKKDTKDELSKNIEKGIANQTSPFLQKELKKVPAKFLDTQYSMKFNPTGESKDQDTGSILDFFGEKKNELGGKNENNKEEITKKALEYFQTKKTKQRIKDKGIDLTKDYKDFFNEIGLEMTDEQLDKFIKQDVNKENFLQQIQASDDDNDIGEEKKKLIRKKNRKFDLNNQKIRIGADLDYEKSVAKLL